MTTPVQPRKLNAREIEILNLLLSLDNPGFAELRAQIPFAQVVATWGPGSPSVDIEVSEGSVPAEGADGELPTSAVVRDRSGGYVGEITLWATAGYLSAIEFAWITDAAPSSLPDLADVSLPESESASKEASAEENSSGSSGLSLPPW